MRISLNKKITIGIISIILLFAAVASTVNVIYLKKEAEKNERKFVEATLTQESTTLKELFAYTYTYLEKIAEDKSVTDLLQNTNSKNLQEIANTRLKEVGDDTRFLAVFVLDAQGTAFASSDKRIYTKSLANKDYFKNAIKGAPSFESSYGAYTSEIGIYVATPIRVNNEPKAVIVGKINPKYIDHLIKQINISTQQDIVLVDNLGLILASSNSQLALRTLGIPTADAQKLLEDRYKDNIKAPLVFGSAQNYIESKNPDAINIDKEPDKTIWLTPIGKYPAYIGTLTNNITYATVIKTEGRNIVIVIAVCALLAVIALSLTTEIILHPIRHIMSMAIALGQGNYLVKNKIKTNDEFEFLGKTLEKNGVILTNSFASLDEKIKERTTILEQRNQQLEQNKKVILAMLDAIDDERKKAQTSAGDLRKYKLAVENASDAIEITDSQNRIIYANKAREKLSGYSLKELLGKTPMDPIIGGSVVDNAIYESIRETVLVKKQVFDGEIRNKRKNGTEYTAEIHISPVLSPLGEIAFIVIIRRDITKIKEVDRMKTEFISLASHQLRTPLTAMKWFAEMLLAKDAGQLNEEQTSYVKTIAEATDRMIELVNGLLNISRIESGRIIVDPKPTNVEQLLNEVITDLSSKIRDRNVKTSLTVEKNIPTINLDQSLIREVYKNFLTNAVKYSPEGSTVEVKLAIKDTDLMSQVIDHGYGIPADEQDKIFNKFFRASNVALIETDGSGLGLYLAKSIVESSGGKIGFESEVNKGTTFWFTLPLSGMQAKEGQVSITSV